MKNFRITAVGNKLYAADVHGDGHSFLSLDLENQEESWQECASMNQARSYPSLVSLQGKVYVLAGEDANANMAPALTSCEVYDPNINKWDYVSPMAHGRSEAGVVTHQDKIIIVGGWGYDDAYDAASHASNLLFMSTALRSVEMFDPSSNTWVRLPDIKEGRHGG